MTTQAFFPTLVYSAQLRGANWRTFNRQLLRECEQLSVDDESGRRWSKKNYPGGYTSYNSVAQLQKFSPTFATLERKLRRHVDNFVRSLELDMAGRELAMTDCWVNVMPPRVAHSWHLHPLATISGTYYAQTPPRAPGLKIEDPRLDRFMASPPRKNDCCKEQRPWITLPAEAGKIILFESWLRHEVPPNTANGERISISFNYNWF